MDFFSVHHVGGRSGFSNFPSFIKLNKSISMTSYEADAECCDEIKQYLKSKRYGSIEVLPECVGLPGKAKFNINFSPFTSSLLQTNKEFHNYYEDLLDCDFVLEDTHKKVKEISLEVKSLDSIEKKNPVDFLSLDTQGSELDILKSSNQSLENALGVLTEVSFLPVYEKCPNFGEISKFLDERGFQFIDISLCDGIAPLTLPIRSRLKKIRHQGDALFLRKTKNNLSIIQKRKLVFASFVFGQIEYAMSCIEGLNNQNTKCDSDWQYVVDKLIQLKDDNETLPMPSRNIKKYLEKFNQKNVIFNNKKYFLQKNLFTLQLIISKIYKFCYKSFNYLKNTKLKFIYKASKLEKLYREIGLTNYSNILRKKRYKIWL